MANRRELPCSINNPPHLKKNKGRGGSNIGFQSSQDEKSNECKEPPFLLDFLPRWLTITSNPQLYQSPVAP